MTRDNTGDVNGDEEAGDLGAQRPFGLDNKQMLTIAAVGVVGLALGAIVMQRRRGAATLPSVDRAIELARSGTVDTVASLKRRLRAEGYSPSQIEGRAKRYVAALLETAADRLRP